MGCGFVVEEEAYRGNKLGAADDDFPIVDNREVPGEKEIPPPTPPLA
jgi:hypothetical protein